MDGKERRNLKALGHHLRPIIQIGQQGIGPQLVEATKEALEKHELVKVKVLESSPHDRFEASETLAKETGAELVQVLGRTFLLFRAREDLESR